MTNHLKVLISAAGLAALVASPVLAASHVRYPVRVPAHSTYAGPNGSPSAPYHYDNSAAETAGSGQ